MSKCNMNFRRGEKVRLNGSSWRTDLLEVYNQIVTVRGHTDYDNLPYFYYFDDPNDPVSIYANDWVDFSARRLRPGER